MATFGNTQFFLRPTPLNFIGGIRPQQPVSDNDDICKLVERFGTRFRTTSKNGSWVVNDDKLQITLETDDDVFTGYVLKVYQYPDIKQFRDAFSARNLGNPVVSEAAGDDHYKYVGLQVIELLKKSNLW